MHYGSLGIIHLLSVMLFMMTTSSCAMTVTVIIMMSSTVTMRVMSMSLSVSMAVMMMVRGGDCNLEVVPCQVGEDSVLYVASEIALLRQRITILLRVYSPPIRVVNNFFYVRVLPHISSEEEWAIITDSNVLI